MKDHNPADNPNLPMSMVSTCSGCGIRQATADLVAAGRSNAVWVIVFLSDGAANMTDTPLTYPYDATTKKGIPAAMYPNGFCGGSIDKAFNVDGINYWGSNCMNDKNNKRYCMNDDPLACPNSYPGHTIVALADPANHFSKPYTPPYGPADYAMDMADAASLRVSDNHNEKLGYDIAIYSIGFDSDGLGFAIGKGEPLLRYMAAVGDDGDRRTDPCSTTAARTSCGQYYFARNIPDLYAVFQDIASRIYTKISE